MANKNMRDFQSHTGDKDLILHGFTETWVPNFLSTSEKLLSSMPFPSSQ